MKHILNSLSSLDNLAPQLNLTYRKKSRMKTAFGGAMVLAIYILISLGLFYFSRDIIYKTNPITKINKTFESQVEVPAETFPLYFLITDRFIRPINPGDTLWNSLEVQIEYWSTTLDQEKGLISYFDTYKVIPCSESYFKGYEKYFAISVHPSSLCVDYSKSFDKEGKETSRKSLFSESAETPTTSHVNVKIKTCDETLNPGCRKALDDMGQLEFFMGHATSVVNFDDFDAPVNNFLDFFQVSISPGLFIRKFATMSLNQFISDNGVILTDTVSETYIDTKMGDTNVLKYSESSRNLFAFSFKVDLVKETMERRYVKIQEILANVGGFMKAILLVATILVKHFSEYTFFKNFANDVNSLCKKQNQGNMVNNLVQSSKNESKMTISPSLNKATIKAEIGFFAFLSGIFYRNKAVTEKEKVFRYLDIGFISGKLIEFEDRLGIIRR